MTLVFFTSLIIDKSKQKDTFSSQIIIPGQKRAELLENIKLEEQLLIVSNTPYFEVHSLLSKIVPIFSQLISKFAMRFENNFWLGPK